MKIRTLLLLASMVACKTTGDPAQYSEWIPFDKEDGLIKFQCWIDGIPARGMIDTGAAGSFISYEFAAAHRIQVSGRNAAVIGGVGGEERISTAREFKVSFKTGGEGVAVTDALILERDLGADLILGLFFFQNVVLQIDYPKSVFRYMTRTASTLQQQANTAIRIGDQFHLQVEVDVHGKKQWLIVDTGTSGSIYLPRRTAKEGGWLNNAKPAGKATIAGIVDNADVEVMVLDAMKIGPYELTDIPLVVQNHSDAQKARSDPKLDTRLGESEDAKPGILGYDVLRHFVVTVDLDLGLLHLFLPG